MTRPTFVRVGLLLVAFCLAASPGRAQGFKWWADDGVQKRLSLSADQSHRIDDIFQQALPGLRTSRQRLESAEQELQQLIERSADDTAVVRQLERVESARGELNKSRTLMLLQMRRVLTPDQRGGLDDLRRARSRDTASDHRAPNHRP